MKVIILIKKFNVQKTKQLDKINKILSLFFKKPVCRREHELNEVKDILVVDFSLIGDMVMNIPFLQNIKYNCPKAKITMVCMPWAEAVLGDQGLVDEFVIFDGKNKLSGPKQILKNWGQITSTIKSLNKKTYQIGFEPKGDLRHTLFLHYIKCDRSITYNYTGGDFLVTDSFKPLQDTKHLIDEKLDLLRLTGFDINQDTTMPVLKLTDEWKYMADKFKKDNFEENRLVVGLHPGASNVNKQYKFYPEIVARIAAEYEEKIQFCIFEGNGEQEAVDSVCKKLNKKQYVRVKKSLKEYITLVSVCDCMICNDSAAGHIAAAYGIPVLVIFGPIMDETARPRGIGRVATISKSCECKPCTMPVCPLGTEKCIKSIGVDEVFDEFKKMIG